MKEIRLSFLFLLIFCFSVKAQNQITFPKIFNYDNEQYHGGFQNWDIAQDRNGILYFGNGDGLVTFNGGFWNIYHLPNYTVIRSVEIDDLNRIFVGGQDEFGYFFPDDNGVLKYNSLVSLLPESERKVADIWDISIYNGEVFFRSTNKIIQYKDGVLKVFKPKVEWQFITSVNNKLFAQSKGEGIYIFDRGDWLPYCKSSLLDQSAITTILPYNGDTLVVSTLKDGLYLMSNGEMMKKETAEDQIFFNDRIYTGKYLGDDGYIYGTTSAGIIHIDKYGSLIQKYSYSEGLQTNNVRALLLDEDGNLWLALEDGIDFIAINSAIRTINPEKSKQTSSYAINIFKNHLFIGTSNGLYTTPLETVGDLSLSKGVFSEVKNTKGQVWSLRQVNNHLLMAHEEGLFDIDIRNANKVYTGLGSWLSEPVSNFPFPNKVIIGTYLGLQLVSYKDGGFMKEGDVSGIAESLRFITFDNEGDLWASHPYRGVFKFTLSEDKSKILSTKIYNKKDGLPSDLYNYVFKIKNRILIACGDGIYEFSERKQKFLPSQTLRYGLKGLAIQYLKEDVYGNIWFVNNKRVGIIDFNKPSDSASYSIIYFPQLDGKVVGGFETIYPVNDQNIFIGANKGVFLINYKKYSEKITTPHVLLGTVKIFGEQDSLIFGGYFISGGKIKFKQDSSLVKSYSKSLNSVHFEFASTMFEQLKNIEFSYTLKGFDNQWSAWDQKKEKDYTNLPPGKYTFHVKARNRPDNNSEITSFTFIILPAWYQTLWMYMVYVILAVFTLYYLFKRQQKIHQKQQERLSYLHQLEIDRNEKEIGRLNYEKLEADFDYKNRELSTMTMHLVQRGEVLSKIKEVISSVIKSHELDDKSASFRHLIRLIRDVERSDEDWDQFTLHFNNVNEDFFNKLKDNFPNLTPNELKLCAYLKMNLSSKEIAQLMNTTIKAVEVGRYRLRKKLKISSEINLYNFLSSFID